MIKVTLHFFAQVRYAAGVETETFVLPADAGLGTVVEQAVKRHGKGFRDLVQDEAGRIRSCLLVLINGTPVPAPRGEAVPLRDGDVVSLMSAMSGG